MMAPDERGHGSVQAQANGTIKWESRCHTICDCWKRQRERKWSSVRHWAAANFGWPPRTKGNLRKFGRGSDSPHQNWEFGEGIPSPTKGAGIGNALPQLEKK